MVVFPDSFFSEQYCQGWENGKFVKCVNDNTLNDINTKFGKLMLRLAIFVCESIGEKLAVYFGF